MDWFKSLVNSPNAIFWVVVVGIPVLIWGILEITKLIARHRERMAMIQRGMHPDAKKQEAGTR